jgi:hypothetical protein
MPEAIQLCSGAQRLVPVIRFHPDDKAECSHCTARLKATRRVENGGRSLYYEMPVHRSEGAKDPSKVDWSQVQ